MSHDLRADIAASRLETCVQKMVALMLNDENVKDDDFGKWKREMLQHYDIVCKEGRVRAASRFETVFTNYCLLREVRKTSPCTDNRWNTDTEPSVALF